MADSRGEVTVLLGELKLGRKDALKRGIPVTLHEERFNRAASAGHAEEILALDPQPARTVGHDWAMAKAWMKTQLESAGSQ